MSNGRRSTHNLVVENKKSQEFFTAGKLSSTKQLVQQSPPNSTHLPALIQKQNSKIDKVMPYQS